MCLYVCFVSVAVNVCVGEYVCAYMCIYVKLLVPISLYILHNTVYVCVHMNLGTDNAITSFTKNDNTQMKPRKKKTSREEWRHRSRGNLCVIRIARMMKLVVR